ncbi:hypothetical protein, partial [Phascolarctobacterium succinatutens]|uniref:hypothetical protein n=1 Tax=Phascolarctobacterium succinatutens TaxID=626940 RepID=UPI004026C38F
FLCRRSRRDLFGHINRAARPAEMLLVSFVASLKNWLRMRLTFLQAAYRQFQILSAWFHL